jgi:hypothetical protein
MANSKEPGAERELDVTVHGRALNVAGTRRVPSAVAACSDGRHTACACYIPACERLQLDAADPQQKVGGRDVHFTTWHRGEPTWLSGLG